MSKLPYFFFLVWWRFRKQMQRFVSSWYVWASKFPLYANQRLGYQTHVIVQYIKRNVTAVLWELRYRQNLQEPWLTHSFCLLLVFLVNEWDDDVITADDSNLIEWEFLNILFGVRVPVPVKRYKSYYYVIMFEMWFNGNSS